MEILVWARISKWEQRSLMMVPNAQAVKRHLADLAETKLPSIATSRVANIVVACLTGNWRGMGVEGAFLEIVDTMADFSNGCQ